MYEVDRISTAAIGKKFNVTDHTVSSYLKSLGCNVSRKRSRTPILSNYFEKIDTQNKAYFLGLIAADGSVFQCNKGKIVFSISLIDKDLLDLLSIEICGSDKLVREVKRKYRDGSSKMYEIKFSDEIFTNNLISNGILINKTFTLDFPNIDEEFISHYIRGYLDGDGTVYKFSGKLFIAFYGNKIFIPKLRDYLFNNNILDKESKRKIALEKANNEYYDINSPHYKNNERFSWAVQTINKRFDENDYYDDFVIRSSKLGHNNYPIIDKKGVCHGLIRITEITEKKKKKVTL